MDSSEGFVVDGRSYVSMSISSLAGAESVVALAFLDPVRGDGPPIRRAVSPTTSGVPRDDPGTLMVHPTPSTRARLVYHTEVVGSDRRLIRCETRL